MKRKLLFIGLALLLIAHFAFAATELALVGEAVDAGGAVTLEKADVTVDALQDTIKSADFVALVDEVSVPDLKIELLNSGGHPTQRFIELGITNNGKNNLFAVDKNSWTASLDVLKGSKRVENKPTVLRFQKIELTTVSERYNDYVFQNHSELQFVPSLGKNQTYDYSVVVDNWKTRTYKQEVWVDVEPEKLAFAPNSYTRLRLWADGVSWKEQVDIKPTIAGYLVDSLAWANTSATHVDYYNLTSKGAQNTTYQVIELLFSNNSGNNQLDYSKATSPANISVYFAYSNGTQIPLFGSTSVGAYWKQYDYTVAAESSRYSLLYARVPFFEAGANKSAIVIYSGTNGGLTQYNSTIVFQDFTFATDFTSDVTSAKGGKNLNQNNANATASNFNRVNTTYGQSYNTCNATNCQNSFYVNTAQTSNITDMVFITRHRLESKDGFYSTTENYFITSPTSYYTGWWATGGVWGCRIGGTNIGSALANWKNNTWHSSSCALNISESNVGTQNNTFWVDGVYNNSRNAGAITSSANSILLGLNIANAFEGSVSFFGYIKGQDSRRVNDSWIVNTLDTQITGKSTGDLDIVFPIYTNVSTTLANGSAYTLSNSTFNVSWFDASGIDTRIFNLNGTNYSIISALSNLSVKSLRAGYYEWYSFANDTSGNANQTPSYGYTISKDATNLTLHLNSSNSALTIYANQTVNTSIVSTNNSYAVTVSLYRNGTLVQTGSAPITNSTTETAVGYFNWTACFAGDENYTSACSTLYLTVNATPTPTPASGGGGGGAGGDVFATPGPNGIKIDLGLPSAGSAWDSLKDLLWRNVAGEGRTFPLWAVFFIVLGVSAIMASPIPLLSAFFVLLEVALLLSVVLSKLLK